MSANFFTCELKGGNGCISTLVRKRICDCTSEATNLKIVSFGNYLSLGYDTTKPKYFSSSSKN